MRFPVIENAHLPLASQCRGRAVAFPPQGLKLWQMSTIPCFRHIILQYRAFYCSECLIIQVSFSHLKCQPYFDCLWNRLLHHTRSLRGGLMFGWYETLAGAFFQSPRLTCPMICFRPCTHSLSGWQGETLIDISEIRCKGRYSFLSTDVPRGRGNQNFGFSILYQPPRRLHNSLTNFPGCRPSRQPLVCSHHIVPAESEIGSFWNAALTGNGKFMYLLQLPRCGHLSARLRPDGASGHDPPCQPRPAASLILVFQERLNTRRRGRIFVPPFETGSNANQ